MLFRTVVFSALLGSCATCPPVYRGDCQKILVKEQLKWARELKNCRSDRDSCQSILEEDCPDNPE